MLVILAIFAATRASPSGLQSSPIVSQDQLQVTAPSCDDPNGCRSLGDIIHSCIITILLCTWVSMHPNIPSPDERWPRIAVRRVGLMLLALFVPEAVIAWALRQRQAATELAKEHKGEGWTITHGFFATMGGFMEYDGNRPIRVLLPEQIESYSLTGNGDFPRISKAEIEDKSKGDAISKGVVILQTSWFVIQCIARGVQGLPITELELVTVAFAALNFVIYVLWWEKPQNVQRGVRVYKKRRTEEAGDDGDIETTVGYWVALRDAVSDLPAAIVRGPSAIDSDFDSWLARVLTWPFVQPLYIMLSYRDNEYEKRVNTFYPDKWVETSENFSSFVVVTITLAFGGIHCIGWTFDFPSNIERTLWRVASISITGIPILVFPLGVLGDMVDNVFKKRFGDFCINMSVILPLSFYLLSRLALLVLSLLPLRSLPSAAFHVVHWTSIIPHV